MTKRFSLITTARFLAKAILWLLGFTIFLAVAEMIGAQVIGYPPLTRFVLHDLPFRGERFDPEKWDEAGGCKGLSDGECAAKEASCHRGPMVRDLLHNYLKPRITTYEKVTQLLGAKEYDVDINGANCPAYSLGMCSGLGIDYDSLYVCFDKDQKISKVGHVQH